MDILEGMGRREFLKSVAAATAALGLGAGVARAQEAAPAAGGAEPLKVGLIGCGGQGNVLLANALRVPDIKIVGVCDIVDARRDETADRAGPDTEKYTEYAEMLEKYPIEAVIIAVPLWKHSEVAIAAFQAGKHVFCEKCMAYTIDECKDMLRAQVQANKVLQIGHHLRYHPLYIHAKRSFIEKGILGDITSVSAQWNRNGPWRREAPQGDYSKWGYPSPEELGNWRLYSKYSGGLMTELGSHQLDAISWMLGKNPTAVCGVGGIDYWKPDSNRVPPEDQRDVPDNVHVIYEYPGGVKVDYQSSTTNAFNIFGSQCCEIFRGTQGTLVMSHLVEGMNLKSAGWLFLEEGVQKQIWMTMAHKVDVYGHEAIHVDATVTEGPKLANQPISTLITAEGDLKKMTYQLEMEEFVISCRTNSIPSCDGMIGMKSAADALLANQAMTSQSRVTFDEGMYAL